MNNSLLKKLRCNISSMTLYRGIQLLKARYFFGETHNAMKFTAKPFSKTEYCPF